MDLNGCRLLNLHSSPRSQRGIDGFTLVEILISLALAVFAITTFYAAAAQVLRIAVASKENAQATQVLQQRMEAFNSNTSWATILTPERLKVDLQPPPSGTNLLGAVETYTISTYPSGTSSFSMTRAADGSVTTSGAAIPDSQKCVTITGRITWTGIGKAVRNRTQVTMLSKGGL